VKIQETKIVDIAPNEAAVSMTIAGFRDLAQADEHMVLTVYVPHEPGLPLEKVQLRALTRAAELIEQQSAAVENKLPRR
jgi:hypothetical protein